MPSFFMKITEDPNWMTIKYSQIQVSKHNELRIPKKRDKQNKIKLHSIRERRGISFLVFLYVEWKKDTISYISNEFLPNAFFVNAQLSNYLLQNGCFLLKSFFPKKKKYVRKRRKFGVKLLLIGLVEKQLIWRYLDF